MACSAAGAGVGGIPVSVSSRISKLLPIVGNFIIRTAAGFAQEASQKMDQRKTKNAAGSVCPLRPENRAAAFRMLRGGYCLS
jgi:hypothetical protein